MRESSYTYRPDEPEQIDKLILESYDQLVQLERRNLLFISGIAWFSSLTKINPKAGNFLGLTFQNLEEVHFYRGLAALVLYFLIAYIVYGYPRFKATRKAKKEILKESMKVTRFVRWWKIEFGRFWLEFKYLGWFIFHYLFPLISGVSAFIICGFKAV